MKTLRETKNFNQVSFMSEGNILHFSDYLTLYTNVYIVKNKSVIYIHIWNSQSFWCN